MDVALEEARRLGIFDGNVAIRHAREAREWQSPWAVIRWLSCLPGITTPRATANVKRESNTQWKLINMGKAL